MMIAGRRGRGPVAAGGGCFPRRAGGCARGRRWRRVADMDVTCGHPGPAERRGSAQAACRARHPPAARSVEQRHTADAGGWGWRFGPPQHRQASPGHCTRPPRSSHPPCYRDRPRHRTDPPTTRPGRTDQRIHPRRLTPRIRRSPDRIVFSSGTGLDGQFPQQRAPGVRHHAPAVRADLDPASPAATLHLSSSFLSGTVDHSAVRFSLAGKALLRISGPCRLPV